MLGISNSEIFKKAAIMWKKFNLWLVTFSSTPKHPVSIAGLEINTMWADSPDLRQPSILIYYTPGRFFLTMPLRQCFFSNQSQHFSPFSQSLLRLQVFSSRSVRNGVDTKGQARRLEARFFLDLMNPLNLSFNPRSSIYNNESSYKQEDHLLNVTVRTL